MVGQEYVVRMETYPAENPLDGELECDFIWEASNTALSLDLPDTECHFQILTSASSLRV